MDKWICKIIFIAADKDYAQAEQITNGYLDLGWELVSVTPSGAGQRVWLRRRR